MHNFEGIEARSNVGIDRDFGRRDTGQETDGRVGIGGLVGNRGILDTRHLTVLPGFASKGVSTPLIEVISDSLFDDLSMSMSTFGKTSIEGGLPTTTTTTTTSSDDKIKSEQQQRRRQRRTKQPHVYTCSQSLADSDGNDV